MDLQLLSVASELYPLVKTGGLADVAGALPAALAGEGVRVTTLVPGYPAVLAALQDRVAVLDRPMLMGGAATVWRGTAAGIDLLVLDAAHLYDRPGNPYLASDGQDWPDNAARFAALARIAADIAVGAIADYVPDVVQVHDWQAALVPAYLHYGRVPHPPVVLTIHNLAFQGRFPAYRLGEIGLPAAAYALDGVEYYGDIGYLKAGILFADHITTVSPTYATEIMTVAGGMGLDGLLSGRAADVTGILNGIDTYVWNPATDPRIAQTFDAATIARRAANKAAVQRVFGLAEDADALLIGVVSRLTDQKGIDLILAALPDLLAAGGQLALLGSGDAVLEDAFLLSAARHPDRIGCRIGYDEDLAHGIQAGADALLVPSRFEPCGLTQLCALRYGAVPIVAWVGGLADTVIHANPVAIDRGAATGIQFPPASLAALRAALAQAGQLFADGAPWQQMQANAMDTDVSWSAPAKRYAALFRRLAD
ncbi:MAG TPA: glycogen synthase GlgA [Sphingomonas sp.]|uniref:glycogen synthase GlgA n=1 Tax=Sphingomonas sp. TaxID=28214 RepID=UPI002EDB69F2